MRYDPLKKHISASATLVVTILHRGADLSSSNPTIIGGKRQRLQEDPDRGAQKRSRMFYFAKQLSLRLYRYTGLRRRYFMSSEIFSSICRVFSKSVVVTINTKIW